MSATSTAKSDYLLLFRGNVWDRGLSPAQLQKVVSDWMAWFERLKEEGKCLGGHPLEDEGKVVSGKQRTVADGPFAESKEAIGGYFYLTVADENEAIEIAKQCPGLEYGSVVEVRPVADDLFDQATRAGIFSRTTRRRHRVNRMDSGAHAPRVLLAEASPVALLTEERQIDLHLLQSIPRERGTLAVMRLRSPD